MADSGKHALVFGASGISGWAIVNQALRYPTTTTFTHITGLTNRPLSIAEARLPADPRLQLINGIDLSSSLDDVVTQMQSIRSIATVTHVFFTAYIHHAEYLTLKIINTDILKVALLALHQCCPAMQSFILQTGGKAYGVEFPAQAYLSPPFTESMPRIPEPEASNIFYYPQHDIVAAFATDAAWRFVEIRPDAIVGFAPTNNAMNLAQGLGIYLTLQRAVHGQGAVIPFPGSEKAYRALRTDTSQDVLARMELHAAVRGELVAESGAVVNVADAEEPVMWAGVWPALCAYFGLVGEGPHVHEHGDEHGHGHGDGHDHRHDHPLPVDEFVRQNMHVWWRLAGEHGLREGTASRQNWAFVQALLVHAESDRQYDLSKARRIGFTERVDTVKGYEIAFERMREAKVIPTL